MSSDSSAEVPQPVEDPTTALDAQIDDKQWQVKAIIDDEKKTEVSDDALKERLDKDYAEYQRVLLEQVDAFQNQIDDSTLPPEKKTEMLQEVLQILQSVGVVEQQYWEVAESSDEVVPPAAAPEAGSDVYEVQDGDTLSKIHGNKFGVAWDAGREDTKKHFAIVMAMNGLVNAGRDPNTAPNTGTSIDLSKIDVRTLDINKGFEDYLAVSSSAPYVSALRALAEAAGADVGPPASCAGQ